MMCSNSYLNHYIKVGQLSKCVISSSEMGGQPLAKPHIFFRDVITKLVLLSTMMFTAAMLSTIMILSMMLIMVITHYVQVICKISVKESGDCIV